MEPIHLLPWIYGGILAAVHYWGEEIAGHPLSGRLTGLSAGVTVSYAFLDLLPRFTDGIPFFGEWGFFTILVGFSLPHIAETFAVQHTKSLEELRKDFKEIHTVFAFIYYTLIGVLLYTLLQQDVVAGTLLFIPVLFHTAVSSLSITELHNDILENQLIRAAVILSILIGVAVASIARFPRSVSHLLLGLVTGLFLYVAISDAISGKRDSDVRLFIVGTVIYSGIITYLWTVF